MRVIGLGAGGHARVLLDSLRLQGYELIGLLDDNQLLWGQALDEVPIRGGLEMLEEASADAVFLGIGSIGSTALRERLFARMRASGKHIVEVRHPSAIVASSAHCGQGAMLLAGTILNPGAWLGDNVIVNTGAIVEHDCRIGDHVHLSPGCVLCGEVEIGAGAHVGAGAVIRQQLRVGAGALIAAGAVVVRHVGAGETVAGVPARPLRPGSSAPTAP